MSMISFSHAGLDVLASSTDLSQGVIILLHGFGADNADLAPLSTMLAPWPSLYPNGPVVVPTSPHTEGRAWFALDMVQLQMRLMTGSDGPYDDVTPPGLMEAGALVKKFVQELDVPLSKILLGGFSQGSMVSLEVALSLDEPLAGVALLSSNKTSGPRWSDQIKAKGKSLHVFQSHGRMDPVLPFSSAARLSDELHAACASHEFIPFGGGHEIPMHVIQGLQAFANQRLGGG